MKKLATFIIAALSASFMSAQDAQLVVQKVDNGNAVPGNTYRVHVLLPSPQHTLHAVFGDDESSMSIQSTQPFYQHQFGGETTLDVNAMALDLAPELAYDSWLTIGAENSSDNNLWEIGIDFNGFNSGDQLGVQDGAWFVVPTDARAMGDQGNLVLVAQLTTEGVATGTLNIQGWDADQTPWQARGLTFTTTDAHTFGCTDQSALNFNNQATFNDGTCEYPASNGNPNQSDVEASKGDQSDWQVFPNPIWENQFNVQFSQVIDLKEGNMTLDIIDMQGKLVHSVEIDDSYVIGGNKIVVQKDLTAGLYTITITQNGSAQSQQLVVQR
ncbi:MAG: T9SS type A sorting domain-containing protein [Flavobacteriales bacterium]|nr:T9SS type A sorting domain-containing protein [Flavobacteriales bacterium]